MTTVNLPVSACTYIDYYHSTTNYESQSVVNISGNNGWRFEKGLYVFNFSTLPAGASVISADLKIYADASTAFTAQTLQAYRLLVDISVYYATWVLANTGVPWTSAGCSGDGTDKAAAQLAEKELTSSGGEWLTVPLDIQEFGLLRDNNKGILLKLEDSETGQIVLSEGANSAYIAINYMSPGGVAFLSDYGVL
jgi:hypothetical protein